MFNRRLMFALLAIAAWLAFGLVMTARLATSTDAVVVYTAQDSLYAEPIFAAYTEAEGLPVRPKFDTEATKTVGLARAIMAEAARPRCDVFWNNEILNTIRLERRGLLEPYVYPQADAYPPQFRSPQGLWYGFAARARIIIVNTDRVSEADRPTSIYDLSDEKWKGQIGIAKPLFGTTATHAACLFSQLGAEDAREYFLGLKRNGVQIMAGNKQVALAVASGQLAFGMTDTDDAIIEVEKGHPVEIVYPDRQPNQLGTLFIPNTLSIVRGAPHPDAARKLIDYLLSGQVEAALAAGASAQIPLRTDTDIAVRVETPRTVHAMPVDFEKAADAWDEAATFIRDEFTGP